MKNKIVTAVYGVLAVLGLVSLTQNLALADQPTSSFYLNGVSGLSLAGVYTSPYLGGTTGTTGIGSMMPVICDDFSDNSYIPEQWTTYVTSLTALNLGNATPLDLKWNAANSNGSVDGLPGWNLTQIQAYDVAADLVLHILTLNNTTRVGLTTDQVNQLNSEQEDYSFALWELFAPTQAQAIADKNWGNDADSVVTWLETAPNVLPADLLQATQDVESAKTETLAGQSDINNFNFTIYSYDPNSAPGQIPTLCGGVSCGTDLPPQEFIEVSAGTTQIRVPEASFFDSFSLYFLAGGAGLVFLSRRKIFRTQA